jgi:hypothetical protein
VDGGSELCACSAHMTLRSHVTDYMLHNVYIYGDFSVIFMDV